MDATPANSKWISRVRGGLSVALIRDPKERLVSAWKSKFACDDQGFHVDGDDRARMMVRLLAHTGAFAEGKDCLTLQEYVTALGICHSDPSGQALMGLNSHTRPQTEDCFSRYPPQAWTRVVSTLDVETLRMIATRAGNASMAAHYPHMHTTSGGAGHPGSAPKSTEQLVASLDSNSRHTLSQITAAEYDMLAPYLT